MNITIDDKLWRFEFDKEVTLEVICALFVKNFKSRNGVNHISIDDLVKYLFYIDMNSLCQTNGIVTGLSYYFNGEGRLRSGELFGIITFNSKNLFSTYTNMYNRKIIKINSLNNISTDNLCTYTEELISAVYYNKVLKFNDTDFDELFNTSTVIGRGLENHIKYITLDFLIDRLDLDRQFVIEDLSLHNLRLRSIQIRDCNTLIYKQNNYE